MVKIKDVKDKSDRYGYYINASYVNVIIITLKYNYRLN